MTSKRIKTKGTYEDGWATKTINLQIGCEHGCTYCYARRIFLNNGTIKTPEEFLEPRISKTAQKWLDRILQGFNPFKKFDGRIMFPSTHDITMNNYEDCLILLNAILEAGNEVLIVTKGNFEAITRVAHDLQLYQDKVEFRFTITTYSDAMLEKYEPNAPDVEERFQTLTYIRNLNYKSSVSIEPFLLADVDKLVEILLTLVTECIFIGPMNPPSPELEWLYDKESLLEIKQKLDALNDPRIRFKDAFLKKLEDLNK